jgi:hypothetical protein
MTKTMLDAYKLIYGYIGRLWLGLFGFFNNMYCRNLRVLTRLKTNYKTQFKNFKFKASASDKTPTKK